jgi:hypothetical protein
MTMMADNTVQSIVQLWDTPFTTDANQKNTNIKIYCAIGSKDPYV